MLSKGKEKLIHTGLLAAKQCYQRMRPRRPEQVVFLAGVQRSGTNMAMDLLERSFETDVYHERDPRAFDNYRMHNPKIISQLIQRSRAPVFVIKCLCELQDLKRLSQQFAPAKIVWIWRDYRDVVNSMLMSFSNQAKQVQRVAINPASDDWRGLGMSEQTLLLVRKLVDEHIDDASAAALQWYFRNVLLFEQQLQQSSNVLCIRYEDLVRQPDQVGSKLFSFLDLKYRPWHGAKMSPRSIGRRSSPSLEPRIQQVCEHLMHRLADET